MFGHQNNLTKKKEKERFMLEKYKEQGRLFKEAILDMRAFMARLNKDMVLTHAGGQPHPTNKDHE